MRIISLALGLLMLTTACSSGSSDTLTVYSGRSEDLVAPLIEQFEAETGIDVEVRYADSAELAATLLEEGDNSPADVFFSQDPASIGSVALAGMLTQLDGEVLGRVDSSLSDREGRWVGISGRSRVLVYDPTAVAELPASVNDLTSGEWTGRVAVAPTNGSFLAFVAAMLEMEGTEATRAWLEAIADAPTYPRNSVIVAAVEDGEVDAGLVNHYYLLRLAAERGEVQAANHFFPTSGAGSLVMPAAVGILETSDSEAAAQQFVEYLLSEPAQAYFADETFEYPLIDGVDANTALPPLADLNIPTLDLSRLAERLDEATDLVAEAGLL